MENTRKELYYKYLNSEEWFIIREDAFNFHGRICKNCKCEKNLQVHHKRYPEIFGNENIQKDLVVLCKRCHRKTHGLEDFATYDDSIVAGEITGGVVEFPIKVMKRIFELKARCQHIHIIMVLLMAKSNGDECVEFSDFFTYLNVTEKGLRAYLSTMNLGKIIFINNGNIWLNPKLEDWRTKRVR